MLIKHSSLDTSALTPSQRMAKAMYDEVAFQWAIGTCEAVCEQDTDWPASYIAYVYATEQAAYQRSFNS